MMKNEPPGLDDYQMLYAFWPMWAISEMNGLQLMVELTRSFLNVKVIAMSGVFQWRKGG